MASKALFQSLCSDSMLQAAWRQVKGKGSAGGVDGVSLAEFEKDLYKNLVDLSDSLKQGGWKPQPYLQIEVPKKNKIEMRKLGLLSVGDKIVQTAIKMLVEPRCERLFTGSSYGYRPHKGATKAIRRTLAECNKKKNQWVLRLDIDNFFDTIDHAILQSRLHAVVSDAEIVRLIMLVVKMGMVASDGKWIETTLGVPQGAVLSPILANLYMHSFDQFVLSRKLSYVRYADDFIILCETREQANQMLHDATNYLQNKLKLTLNTPCITPLNEGFEFLGVSLNRQQISVSEKKQEELLERISTLEIDANGWIGRSRKSWKGISAYYGELLQQETLETLDRALIARLRQLATEEFGRFANVSVLQRTLSNVNFLSKHFTQDKRKIIADIVADYKSSKGGENDDVLELANRKIIQSRKREYRNRESERSELLVNKSGTFVGITNRGITVREKGTVLSQQNSDSISHIVITGNGVSMSSNLLGHCLKNNIPIDIFDNHGTHIGSFLSPAFMERMSWRYQQVASKELRMKIAANIMLGKLKNQFNLVKYFHKYHKSNFPNLIDRYNDIEKTVNEFLLFKKTCDYSSPTFIEQLVGFEAQTAVKYWAYIRELLADDNISFEKREHRGATDLVNSMLNYGYAILYARVWQAILAAKLNPYDSLIHAVNRHNPTFVYDVIELFRSQVVDRVVITLIQKKTELTMNKALLSDDTRRQLAQNVMERLNRYEKYRSKEMKMERILTCQAMEIAACFKGDGAYRPYIAKW